VALAVLGLLASVSVVGTGCAVLNSVMGGSGSDKVTQADVDAAVAAKDATKLQQICSGKTQRPVKNQYVSQSACEEEIKLRIEEKNYARLKEICETNNTGEWRGDPATRMKACDAGQDRSVSEAREAVLAASCSDLPTTFAAKKNKLFQFGGKSNAMREGRELFVKLGLKAAECQKWDFIIEQLMHWGEAGGYGEVVTRTMFEKIPDFEDKVLAYMSAHMSDAGAFEHSDYAFDHYVTILDERHMFKNCKKYFPYAAKVPDRTWQMFNWYFRQAKCKGAEKLAVKRLGSDRASTRQGACKTIALLGNKRKHLKLLKRLATSDPFYVLHKDTIPAWKEYKVRDTCAKAANQLSFK